MARIDVKSTAVTVISGGADEDISFTDIARTKNNDHTDDLIRNRPRNRNTLEFQGIWEQPSTTGINPVEFDGIKMQAGLTEQLEEKREHYEFFGREESGWFRTG